jgi:hypothetical protein
MYYDVSLLANDPDFRARSAAAFAVESYGDISPPPPYQWSADHSWQLASAPGFGDAYAYALANGNETPGRDASVITDEQLLSAVQKIISDEAPPPEVIPEAEPKEEPQEPSTEPSSEPLTPAGEPPHEPPADNLGP